MENSSGIGIFLIVTGLVIVIPVTLQIRDHRFGWREAWGMFVLAGGFLLAGAAYALADGVTLRWLALTGAGAVLFGLFVQHRRRDTNANNH